MLRIVLCAGVKCAVPLCGRKANRESGLHLPAAHYIVLSLRLKNRGGKDRAKWSKRSIFTNCFNKKMFSKEEAAAFNVAHQLFLGPLDVSYLYPSGKEAIEREAKPVCHIQVDQSSSGLKQ